MYTVENHGTPRHDMRDASSVNHNVMNVGDTSSSIAGDTDVPVRCAESGVTRRKLLTPGTAEEHKRQETPTHISCTWHYRKGSPGVKTHNTNQHRCLQHSHHPPSGSTQVLHQVLERTPTDLLNHPDTGGLRACCVNASFDF